MLAGCGAGLTGLLLTPRVLDGPAGQWTGAALLVLLPLLGLGLATGGAWTALFRRPTWRDIGVGLAFAPVTFLASAAVALVVSKAGPTSANPAFELITEFSTAERAAFLGATAVQLLGEELITILPFLVILTIAARTLPRRGAILLAWTVTALMFGAIHLPTYHWRLEQSLLVIGAARLALTASWLVTKNLWTSFVAHLANDWSLFAFAMLVAARA